LVGVLFDVLVDDVYCAVSASPINHDVLTMCVGLFSNGIVRLSGNVVAAVVGCSDGGCYGFGGGGVLVCCGVVGFAGLGSWCDGFLVILLRGHAFI
jgi:hypothetical protein